jgi:hypothetical protein
MAKPRFDYLITMYCSSRATSALTARFPDLAAERSIDDKADIP